MLHRSAVKEGGPGGTIGVLNAAHEITRHDARSAAGNGSAPGGLGIALDRLSARRLFEQLADALRARIVGGTILPDRKMPTEEALSKDLDVGRSTVTRLFKMLGHEGLVVFVPGRGSFTAPAHVIVKARKKR